MGRLTGILGLLTMLGLAYAFSTNRQAIRLKTVAWGLGLQITFAIFVLQSDAGRWLFQRAGTAGHRLLSCSFFRSGKTRFVVWLLLRLSGFADDYIHRRIFRPALSHRRDAAPHSLGGMANAAGDGRKRGRVAKRGREYLHGADRGAADDSPLPGKVNQV